MDIWILASIAGLTHYQIFRQMNFDPVLDQMLFVYCQLERKDGHLFSRDIQAPEAGYTHFVLGCTPVEVKYCDDQSKTSRSDWTAY